jgi:hypothetical protein
MPGFASRFRRQSDEGVARQLVGSCAFLLGANVMVWIRAFRLGIPRGGTGTRSRPPADNSDSLPLRNPDPAIGSFRSRAQALRPHAVLH